MTTVVLIIADHKEPNYAKNKGSYELDYPDLHRTGPRISY